MHRAPRPTQDSRPTVPRIIVEGALGTRIDTGIGKSRAADRCLPSLRRDPTTVVGWCFPGEFAKRGQLRQVAPSVTRAAVLRDETNPSAIAQFGVIQAVASSVGLEAFPVSLRDAAGIGRALATLAGSGDGGLILTSPGRANVLRTHIIKLAAQHKLPVVCPYRYMITDGGLISYGPDLVDQYRRAAGYVDRILRGEKPADMPVQAPTKYELVVNLKTARALGLEVPPTLLARADEAIE